MLFASGADLQSINPLRHAASARAPGAALRAAHHPRPLRLGARARGPTWRAAWAWSRRPAGADASSGCRACRWHDGAPDHRARRALDARGRARSRRSAIRARPSSPRSSGSTRPTTRPWSSRFAAPPPRFPDVLTDLAILPAHLLDTVPRDRAAPGGVERGAGRATARSASWRTSPTAAGSSPPTPTFPRALGGPPRLERLIVVVVDEPATKLAALTAGELDFAGIQPAHAEFVARDPDARGAELSAAAHLRRSRSTPAAPPFDALAARRRLDAAIDRREIVDGYLYGYGTPARDAGAPDVPGYVPVAARHGAPRRAGPPLRFELLTVGSGEAPLEQMVQARLRAAGIDVDDPAARAVGASWRGSTARRTISTPPCSASRATRAWRISARSPRWRASPRRRDPAAAQRMFADSVPVAVLYHARGLQGMNRRVRGVTHGSSGRAADGARLVGRRRDGRDSAAAAPVRLDFAGGWTDVPPFSAREGGVVVSAAIGLHAHAEVRPGRRPGCGWSPRTWRDARPARRGRASRAGAAVAAAGRAAHCCRSAPARSPPGPTRRPAPGSAARARSTWRSWPRWRRRAARRRSRARSPDLPAGSRESRPASPAAARTSSPPPSAASCGSSSAIPTSTVEPLALDPGAARRARAAHAAGLHRRVPLLGRHHRPRHARPTSAATAP